jgi:hypothetical protein
MGMWVGVGWYVYPCMWVWVGEYKNPRRLPLGNGSRHRTVRHRHRSFSRGSPGVFPSRPRRMSGLNAGMSQYYARDGLSEATAPIAVSAAGGLNGARYGGHGGVFPTPKAAGRRSRVGRLPPPPPPTPGWALNPAPLVFPVAPAVCPPLRPRPLPPLGRRGRTAAAAVLTLSAGPPFLVFAGVPRPVPPECGGDFPSGAPVIQQPHHSPPVGAPALKQPPQFPPIWRARSRLYSNAPRFALGQSLISSRVCCAGWSHPPPYPLPLCPPPLSSLVAAFSFRVWRPRTDKIQK